MLKNYTDTSNLLYLRPEAEQIASWVIEQGRIAEAIEASENVIEMHKAA